MDGNKILILSYGSLLETGVTNEPNIGCINGVIMSAIDKIKYDIEMHRTPSTGM